VSVLNGCRVAAFALAMALNQRNAGQSQRFDDEQIWPIPENEASLQAPAPKACPIVEHPLAELDGAALRWLLIVAPELKRFKVDPAKYTIQVKEGESEVVVFFLAPTPGLNCKERKFIRGSPGIYPDFAVGIDKKTRKVLDAAFQK